MLRRHAHGRVDRWRRSWTVRSACRARIVLGAAPAQANTGVADGVALHLIDGHLGGVTLNELDEAAAFAGRNFDVSNLAKALEKGAKLVLGDVAGQAADKDGGVIRVGELIHRLGLSVVAHWCSTHGIHAHRSSTTNSLAGHAHRSALMTSAGAARLRSSRRDSHRPIATVDALHLVEGTLLVLLIRETDKSIATRNAGDGIGHDLGRLAGREAVLKQRYKDELVDFRAEIAHKDGMLGWAFLTAG